MADQINMRANGTAPPALFQPFKNNNIFRLDEGYSEETRSQAGSELPMDARMSEVMDADGSLPSLLPEWTGNMSESARSGMFLFHPSHISTASFLHVACITVDSMQ